MMFLGIGPGYWSQTLGLFYQSPNE